MDEITGILPGLPAVAGKPVHVTFDGGRLTSDGGILLLAAIEQRLEIAERLAACIEDPRDPERVRHGFAEMIRYRALLIAAGYPDGNDCDALKSDPAFKMAVGRLPESGEDLCSQPTISRLENLPGATALKRMMAAMVELFCDSFEQVPRRILLDIDDTEDRVHGGQQLSLWNAHYDSRCFLPIHIYEATTGKPVAIVLRPGKTPDGAEVALVLRHVIGRIRARWPRVEIIVRGDSHYGRPEAMAWCERKTRHQLFLPDELSRRLTAMAKSQKRSRSDLLLEMVEAYMNRRSASQTEDRVTAKLDRLAREVSRISNECVVISHSLYRFIRHQLIYAATLPAPGDDAKALGEKRFQAFLDSVAQMMAKGADNDNEPPEADKANEA